MKKYLITIALTASVLVAGAQRLPLDRLKPYTIAELDSIKSINYKRDYVKKYKFTRAAPIAIDANHLIASYWDEAVARWDTAGVDWQEIPKYQVPAWDTTAFLLVRERFLRNGIRIRVKSNIFGFRKL